MQRRRTLKRQRPLHKAPPASSGNGNGHAKGNGSAPLCPAFDTCAPRFLALERESAQVSNTLGLLLQAQETASAQLEGLTRGIATIDRVMRLVCQAHELNLDELKD